MPRLLQLLILGGLSATILLQAPTIHLGTAESGSIDSKPLAPDVTQEPSTKTQGNDAHVDVIDGGVKDCFKDHGCLAQTVTATSRQKSRTGTTCKSGMACTHPNASCALGGTMKCQTIDLKSGNCVCACTK